MTKTPAGDDVENEDPSPGDGRYGKRTLMSDPLNRRWRRPRQVTMWKTKTLVQVTVAMQIGR